MNKARIFMVAAAAMTLLIACGIAAFLHGQAEYVPPNQVSQTNVERSQMFLTGTGYTLDKEQEKNHQKTEKQREEQQKETPPEVKKPRQVRSGTAAPVRKVNSNTSAKSNSGKSRTSSGGQTGTGGQKKPSSTQPNTQKPSSTESEEDKAKKPVIRLSIASGEEIRGKRLDFTVTVTDYKGRNVPVFSEDDGSFTVTCNGAGLSSSGADGNRTAFRTDLRDGENQITVTATDRDGNTSTKTIRFTGITSEAAEVTGQVYACIRADVLNLGIIADAYVEITSGDTAKDVLESVFDQAGISPNFKGGYLAGISRPGLSEGAYVADDLRGTMEDMRKTEKDPNKQDRNQLKEHDFYDSSGWIYCVNGEFPEKNLGSYKMEDGDELILLFQLAEGIY